LSKNSGCAFGQKTPPLVTFLKGVLERYPDGDQILKELLQNADDAGAGSVKFVFDPNEYGSEKLLNEGLAKFQVNVKKPRIVEKRSICVFF
jgi:sacsin